MKEGMNEKLKTWRETLKNKRLKISRTKTEYMKSVFNENNQTNSENVFLGIESLPKTDSFKYLASMLHKNGGIKTDIDHRIKTGWLKWMGASGVLCDPKVPTKLKGKFYNTAIRLEMLYGSEC